MAKLSISTISDFISNNGWSLPSELLHIFPNIPAIVKDIYFLGSKPGWIHTSSSELGMNDAYQSLVPVGQKVPWAKELWNLAIPPSKTLLMWKIIDNNISTYDIIVRRGINNWHPCAPYAKPSQKLFNIYFFTALLLFAFGHGSAKVYTFR